MDKLDEKIVEQIFNKHKTLSDNSDNETDILVNEDEYDLILDTGIIHDDIVKINGVKNQVIVDIVENDMYNDIIYNTDNKINNKIKTDEYTEEELVYNILNISVNNNGKNTVKHKDDYIVVENKSTDRIKSFVMTEDSNQYLLIEIVKDNKVLDIMETMITVKIEIDTDKIAFKPNTRYGTSVRKSFNIDIGDSVEYESKEWIVSKFDGINSKITISRINSATGDKIHKSISVEELLN